MPTFASIFSRGCDPASLQFCDFVSLKICATAQAYDPVNRGFRRSIFWIIFLPGSFSVGLVVDAVSDAVSGFLQVSAAE